MRPQHTYLAALLVLAACQMPVPKDGAGRLAGTEGPRLRYTEDWRNRSVHENSIRVAQKEAFEAVSERELSIAYRDIVRAMDWASADEKFPPTDEEWETMRSGRDRLRDELVKRGVAEETIESLRGE